MNQIAQTLASKGRNGDSMLVHMAPEEVRGLQALAMAHGGSLSINPDTGLVEANFLKKLLPTLIGVGLGAMGVPTWAIGLGVGGIEGARTGDLGKGIMAGLGAFGGASMAGSLFGSAASTAAPVVEAGAANAATVSPVTNPAALTVNPIAPTPAAPIPAAPPPVPTGGPMQLASANFGSTMTDVGGGMGSIGDASLRMGPSIGSPAGSVAGKAGDLLASQKPPSLLDKATGMFDKAGTKYMEMFDKNPLSTGLMTVGGISALMPPKGVKGPDTEGYYADFKRRFGYDPRTRQYPIPGAAAGGDFSETELGRDEYAKGGIPIKEGSFIMPARETAEFGNGSSNAGLAALSRMGARPIHGPGDGVSDSIRANIGGRQEARVARDEAYFPPEAVARIGGGNHKKGTKKLYAMMKAAQDARKKADRGQDTGLRGLLA